MTPAYAPATGARRRRLVAWLLIRLTGLLLSVLVIGHFALTHILTDVAATDSAFVAASWSSLVIIAWDWVMLVAAALHGGVGIALMIEDYATSPDMRRRLRVALGVLVTVMLIGGTLTILRAAGN